MENNAVSDNIKYAGGALAIGVDIQSMYFSNIFLSLG